MTSPFKKHANLVASRYDEFQTEAVANLLMDYRQKKNGRYLLVIPTGGGKTYTAVKVVNRLFATRVLDPNKDQVVWGAHRKELVNQAKKTFEEYAVANPDSDYSTNVRVRMMREILAYVADNSDCVRIAVIDEAHHATGSNITYGGLFDYPHLGILGLTATPSRHDGRPLDFDKESFSIGFPDLVERQLILLPEVHQIKGGTFEEVYARGVMGFSGLNELDSPERDKKIIGQLLTHSDAYEKIIIYAATKDHVRNLHQRITNSELINQYEAVDYILGGNDYSGNDATREDFITRIQEYKRSIIVNCDVLTEGYDDPTVNTVVMAAPTRSKLVYMQAIGRCIRVDKDNPLKKAFIVEVEDDLPNILYRINNRWLFSDISDTLEPEVVDRVFSSAEEFKTVVGEILHQYDVNDGDIEIPEWDKAMRYSLLLFKSYVGEGEYRHIPILIDGQNRSDVSNWFNFLSERMASFHARAINSDVAMKMARCDGINGLEKPPNPQLIYEAMEESYKKVVAETIDEGLDEAPWITFVAFRFKGTQLPPELMAFLEDLVNKDQMMELVKTRFFRSGDYLIKLPLPLMSSVGMIISADDFNVLESLIQALGELRDESGQEDHLHDVDGLLKSTVLPIPPMYLYSLPTVVRENTNYFFKLE